METSIKIDFSQKKKTENTSNKIAQLNRTLKKFSAPYFISSLLLAIWLILVVLIYTDIIGLLIAVYYIKTVILPVMTCIIIVIGIYAYVRYNQVAELAEMLSNMSKSTEAYEKNKKVYVIN